MAGPVKEVVVLMENYLGRVSAKGGGQTTGSVNE